MTGPTDDDSVGYGRPPKHTRWKKGECGNPGRRRAARKLGTLALIDELLHRLISITINGKRRRISGAQVIMMKLLDEEIAGNPRAMKVRLQYEALAREGRGPPTFSVEGGMFMGDMIGIPMPPKPKGIS